jgi:hypothetical protein
MSDDDGVPVLRFWDSRYQQDGMFAGKGTCFAALLQIESTHRDGLVVSSLRSVNKI